MQVCVLHTLIWPLYLNVFVLETIASGHVMVHVACVAPATSLMDQLSETANSQILRLELENQRLRRQLEESSESVAVESASKMLELEKENIRLSQKVDKLLTDVAEKEKRTTELETTLRDISRMKNSLEETVDTLRENGERHVRELEREIEQLTQTVVTVRERSEQTNDDRVLDLERENKKLSERILSSSTQLSRLECENKQLEKSCERLTATVKQLRCVEERSESQEVEIDSLKKTVKTLQMSCEKLELAEQELTSAQVENARLTKSVELLQQSVAKKDEVETENVKLAVEVQHLKRNSDSLKASAERVANLEHEKEELKSLVRKMTEDSAAMKSFVQQLEMELSGSEVQNTQLNESVRSFTGKLETLQHENEELERHNKSLEACLAEQKQTGRKAEAVRLELDELQEQNKQLLKDKCGLDKEIKKIKQATVAKEAEIDELSSKVFELEHTNKGMLFNCNTSKCYTCNLLINCIAHNC